MAARWTDRGSAVWVLLGTAVSGLATYALLVVVARAVGPVEYSGFSLFWTVVVVVSLGVFLPIEQLTARQVARRLVDGGSSVGALRHAVRSGCVAVLVVAVVLLGVLWRLRPDDLAEVALALVAALAGFVGQFAARGVLAGHRQLRGYAVVLSVDAGGRLLIAAVLLVAGVTTSGPFMVAVSASCLACAVVGVVLARRATARHARAPQTPDADWSGASARETASLVAAASCMQLLLNSGVLAAGAADGAAPELAGVVLAVLTLVRLPVFAVQAAQAAYLSRIAALSQARDSHGLRVLLAVLAALVGTVAAVTFAGAWAIGPQLVALLFGPGYDVTRTMVALAGLGIALYLSASVLNDVAVALRARRAVATAWPTGAVLAVAAYLVPSDVVVRATLPLVVGAATAATILLPAVVTRVRHLATTAPAVQPDPLEAPGA